MRGTDLFGNPIRPGHGGKGRPAFEATADDRNKIKLLLAMGWSNERIASAIGCSPATLKRHFRAELKIRDAARAMLDAERLSLVWGQARKGNVGALKLFGQMVERNDLMEAEAMLRLRQAATKMRGQGHGVDEGGDGDADNPAPSPKLGKKELADRAAREAAGGDWGSDLDLPLDMFPH